MVYIKDVDVSVLAGLPYLCLITGICLVMLFAGSYLLHYGVLFLGCLFLRLGSCVFVQLWILCMDFLHPAHVMPNRKKQNYSRPSAHYIL